MRSSAIFARVVRRFRGTQFRLFLLMSMTCLLSQDVYGQSCWRHEIVDSQAGHRSGIISLTSVGIDPASNHPVIAYVDEDLTGPNPRHNVRYAQWDGSTWSTEEVADTTYSKQISLAYSPSGLPSITYHSALMAPWNILLASHDGGAWNFDTIRDDAFFSGMVTALSYNSTGYPCVAFHLGGCENWGDYIYSCFDGSSWTEETVGNNNTCLPWSLVHSSAGPAIGMPGRIFLRNGATWTEHSSSLLAWDELTLTTNGTGALFYAASGLSVNGIKTIVLGEWNGSGWNTEEIELPDTPGWGPFFSVKAPVVAFISGQPVIAYGTMDTLNRMLLWFAWRDNGSWYFQQLAFLNSEAAYFRSIGVSPGGQINIAYRVDTQPGEADLRVARKSCLSPPASVGNTLRMVKIPSGVEATWTDDPNGSFYRLYRASLPNPEDWMAETMAGEASAGTEEIVDLVASGTYYYRLVPFDQCGCPW